MFDGKEERERLFGEADLTQKPTEKINDLSHTSHFSHHTTNLPPPPPSVPHLAFPSVFEESNIGHHTLSNTNSQRSIPSMNNNSVSSMNTSTNRPVSSALSRAQMILAAASSGTPINNNQHLPTSHVSSSTHPSTTNLTSSNMSSTVGTLNTRSNLSVEERLRQLSLRTNTLLPKSETSSTTVSPTKALNSQLLLHSSSISQTTTILNGNDSVNGVTSNIQSSTSNNNTTSSSSIPTDIFTQSNHNHVSMGITTTSTTANDTSQLFSSTNIHTNNMNSNNSTSTYNDKVFESSYVSNSLNSSNTDKVMSFDKSDLISTGPIMPNFQNNFDNTNKASIEKKVVPPPGASSFPPSQPQIQQQHQPSTSMPAPASSLFPPSQTPPQQQPIISTPAPASSLFPPSQTPQQQPIISTPAPASSLFPPSQTPQQHQPSTSMPAPASSLFPSSQTLQPSIVTSTVNTNTTPVLVPGPPSQPSMVASSIYSSGVPVSSSQSLYQQSSIGVSLGGASTSQTAVSRPPSSLFPSSSQPQQQPSVSTSVTNTSTVPVEVPGPPSSLFPSSSQPQQQQQQQPSVRTSVTNTSTVPVAVPGPPSSLFPSSFQPQQQQSNVSTSVTNTSTVPITVPGPPSSLFTLSQQQQQQQHSVSTSVTNTSTVPVTVPGPPSSLFPLSSQSPVPQSITNGQPHSASGLGLNISASPTPNTLQNRANKPTHMLQSPVHAYTSPRAQQSTAVSPTYDEPTLSSAPNSSIGLIVSQNSTKSLNEMLQPPPPPPSSSISNISAVSPASSPLVKSNTPIIQPSMTSSTTINAYNTGYTALPPPPTGNTSSPSKQNISTVSSPNTVQFIPINSTNGISTTGLSTNNINQSVVMTSAPSPPPPSAPHVHTHSHMSVPPLPLNTTVLSSKSLHATDTTTAAAVVGSTVPPPPPVTKVAGSTGSMNNLGLLPPSSGIALQQGQPLTTISSLGLNSMVNTQNIVPPPPPPPPQTTSYQSLSSLPPMSPAPTTHTTQSAGAGTIYRTPSNVSDPNQPVSGRQSSRRTPRSPRTHPSYENTPRGNSSPRRPTKSRIDPSQMPRPPNLETDVVYYTRQGNGRKVPPLSNTGYQAVDNGNCNPRYIRITTTAPAISNKLQSSSGLPLGLVLTPFAALENLELDIPIINYDNLPIRCTRCRGYINPFVSWTKDGHIWVCNLCHMNNDVPAWYYSSLDGTGSRLDRDFRNELCCGSYDMVATKDYSTRPLQESIYVFGIDISPIALATGLTPAIIRTIESVLKTLPKNEYTKVGLFTYDSNIQFYQLTGNHNQQNTIESSSDTLVEGIRLYIVNSDDPIPAIPPSYWIYNLLTESTKLDAVLTKIIELVPMSNYKLAEEIAQNHIGKPTVTGYTPPFTPEMRACPMAALKVAQLALAVTGGQIYLFTSHDSTIGYGRIPKCRENLGNYGNDNEFLMYGDIDLIKELCTDPNQKLLYDEYIQYGKICHDQCITVNMIITTPSMEDYRDIGLWSYPVDMTGGKLHYLTGSLMDDDNIQRLEQQILLSIHNVIAYDSVMKVRTSIGMKIGDIYGQGKYIKIDDECSLCSLDCENTFICSLEHTSIMKDEDPLYIQLAVLYTNKNKQRLIRIHNLAVNYTNNPATIYKGADLDGMTTYLTKMTMQKALTSPLSVSEITGPRSYISKMLIDILSKYRSTCSSTSPKTQLILPESLKLLPLYTLGLMKHPSIYENRMNTSIAPTSGNNTSSNSSNSSTVLFTNTTTGTNNNSSSTNNNSARNRLINIQSVNIRAHERAYEIRKLRSMKVRDVINDLYPRMYVLHALSDNLELEIPILQESQPCDLLCLPRLPGTASEYFDSDGLYLIADSSALWLYLGRSLPSTDLKLWFNLDMNHIAAKPKQLRVNMNDESSRRIQEAIDLIRHHSVYKQELRVVWGDDPTTPYFERLALRLTEDSIRGEMSYVDFLCKVHAKIQQIS